MVAWSELRHVSEVGYLFWHFHDESTDLERDPSTSNSETNRTWIDETVPGKGPS